jgi:hypothetical protein
MTNEKKAIDIAEDNTRYYGGGEYDSFKECKQSALDMAKWKDKQLWLLIDAIDHAYLQTNGTYGGLSYEVADKVNYLKQVMKGE